VKDTGRVLQIAPGMKCWHKRFIIDETLDTVECRDCGEKLNPMYALKTLARQESQYHQYHARYQDELRRLSERSKTKCEHCRKMTRISQK
jgi:DNA-directed RNA polymerase subunit RPC12/RpoP